MRSLLKLAVTTAAATAMVVGTLASVVDAREFRMKGGWIQQRGPNVQIPILGGINAGNTLISATGSSPADMTVPVNAFTGMNAFAFPLPQTSLVQLTTMFSFGGPVAAGAFSDGAKGTRPANFGWCFGAVPQGGCTTPQTNGGDQGTAHGLVKYTAGANQFGGTMRMLISGTGEVSRIVGTSPLRIQHNTIGGGSGAQVNGGAYGNSNTNLLPGGPITSGGICAGGVCGLNGLVTIAGVPDGTGTASTNTNVGFPWTTGTVSAIVTTMLPLTNSTLTASGSDDRTDLGAGNITMVAGAIALRKPVGAVFPSIDTVTLTMTTRNVPTMSPIGMAGLAGLLIAGAGLAARRRNRNR